MFKFTKEIKVVPEQYALIKGLAKELNHIDYLDEKGITYLLIEMGMGALIASRKNKLEEMFKFLNKKIQKDKGLIEMCKLLEKWWEAGKEVKPELN